MAIIDSTIKMERFRKFLEKRFKTIQLEDTKGVADREFSEVLSQFKVASSINPNFLSLEDLSLFEGSLYTNHFFSGMVFVPQSNGVYLYHKVLKHLEERSLETPRFVNSVVAYYSGVPTPRPLALLLGESMVGHFISAYVGCDNLFIELYNSYENRKLQEKVAEEKKRCLTIEKILIKKHFSEDYELPLELLNRLGKSKEDFEKEIRSGDRMDFSVSLDKNFGKSIKKPLFSLPFWFHSLAYCIKHKHGRGNDEGKVQREIREELQTYTSAVIRCGKLKEKLFKKRRRKPEEIKLIAKNFGIALKKSSDLGVFLYDIEPRDVVLDPGLNVYFADMEGVEFYEKPLSFEERERQFAIVENGYDQPFVAFVRENYFVKC